MSLHAYPPPLVGAFNDAGNIGHHEGTVVVVAYDTQIGLQGGEGVGCNFRFGRSDSGQQGGFAGVGETYQTYVGQEFELQDKPAFLPFLPAGDECLLTGHRV